MSARSGRPPTQQRVGEHPDHLPPPPERRRRPRPSGRRDRRRRRDRDLGRQDPTEQRRLLDERRLRPDVRPAEHTDPHGHGPTLAAPFVRNQRGARLVSFAGHRLTHAVPELVGCGRSVALADGVSAPRRGASPRPAGPTPSRSSPTTSPTPRPPRRRRGRSSTTAPRATSRPASTCAFAADIVHDLITRLAGREHAVGRRAGRPCARPTRSSATFRDPEFVASLAETPGPRHLDADMEMVQDTFRSFADNVVAPHAEHVHRTNGDVPEDDHRRARRDRRVRAVGARRVRRLQRGRRQRVPRHGHRHRRAQPGQPGHRRFADHPPGDPDAGRWSRAGRRSRSSTGCRKLATAEVMAAVAVTEPDFGSDVAGLKVTATPADGPDGAPGYVINGVKTWCTFAARADVLMLLARTDPDRAKTHRGLSLFVVPKPRGDGHGFEFDQDGRRGRPEGQDGGPPDRHDRLPRHAQLRDRAGGLVGAGRPPDRRGRRARARLLLPDGGLRERPAADRRPRRRRDAGRLRGGARLRPQPHGVRLDRSSTTSSPGPSSAGWPC